MASKNSLGLTRITMTPKTAKAFCIVAAVAIVILLSACAMVAPERSHGGGGHGGSGEGGQTTVYMGLTISEGKEDITVVGIASDIADHVVDGLLVIPSEYVGGRRASSITTIGNGTDPVIDGRILSQYGITRISFPSSLTSVSDNAFRNVILTCGDDMAVDITAENLAGKTMAISSSRGQDGHPEVDR